MRAKNTSVDDSRGELKLYKTMVDQLKTFGLVDTLAIVNSILQKHSEILYVDADRCSKCGGVLVYDAVKSLSICKTCHLVINNLFVTEDSTVDVLILRSNVSGTSENSRKRKQGIVSRIFEDNTSRKRYKHVMGASKSKLIDVSKDQDVTKTTYVNRLRQLHAYVNQFRHDRPEIPMNIMSMVYRDLNTMHLNLSLKCRSTPVVNILRNHKQFDWVNYTNLIVRTFNGQVIPVFHEPLLQRLRLRATILLNCMTDLQWRTFTFDVLLHVCLFCEKETEMAHMFPLLKTRNVLVKINTELQQILAKCRLHDANVSWDIARLC